MRRKKKMSPELEKDYYQQLMSLVNKNLPGLTQNQLLIEINKYARDKGYQITQPELSKDLSKINIVKVKETIKSIVNDEEILETQNVFRYKEPIPAATLPPIFSEYIRGKSNLFKKPKCLKIPVKEGTEQIVCKELCEHYGHANLIYIPAYKAVCIIVLNSESAITKIETIQEQINKL